MFINISIGKYHDYRDWFLVDDEYKMVRVYLGSTDGVEHFVGLVKLRENHEGWHLKATATGSTILESMILEYDNGDRTVIKFFKPKGVDNGDDLRFTYGQ